MTRDEAREKLNVLNATIAHAVGLIGYERATLEQYFEDQRIMESVGPILDPTLFNSSERRATEALLSPIYRAALNLVEVYERQTTSAKAALETVKQGAGA